MKWYKDMMSFSGMNYTPNLIKIHIVVVLVAAEGT
jgi:hypothetical protein